ncbi:MAG TPA: FecR domain-containing protein [Gemmatimonadales bacterium]
MNEDELLKRARQLPASIEPPRDLWPDIAARINRPARTPAPVWLALAASVVVLVGGWLALRPAGTSWRVATLAGRPTIGARRIESRGRLRVGQELVTDGQSRARVTVGTIGEVAVEPNTRLRLLAAAANDQRLALERGTISAQVDAPPRIFFVETPAGVAADLGCAYTLTVDSTGRGVIHVTAGYVEFAAAGRRSIVSLGSWAETRPGVGPGIPYVSDAPAALRDALTQFDFAGGGSQAALAALAAARPQDATSLWHLLQRVDQRLRARVYERLAALAPPPPGVTRAAVLRLDAAALDAWWNPIRRAAWRREILKGVRSAP